MRMRRGGQVNPVSLWLRVSVLDRRRLKVRKPVRFASDTKGTRAGGNSGKGGCRMGFRPGCPLRADPGNY